MRNLCYCRCWRHRFVGVVESLFPYRKVWEARKGMKKGFSVFSTKASVMLCFQFELEHPFANSGFQFSRCFNLKFACDHKHPSLIRYRRGPTPLSISSKWNLELDWYAWHVSSLWCSKSDWSRSANSIIKIIDMLFFFFLLSR